MKNQWLVSLLFIGSFVGTASAQDFQIPDKGDLKRGSQSRLYMTATTSKPIIITEIVAITEEGFHVVIDPKCPCPVDGARVFTVTVSRKFWTGLGGPNAGLKTANLKVNYTVDGKPNDKVVPFTFTYRTAAIVYYFYGFLGLLLGYIVKSLLTKRTEKTEDGKPLEISYIQYIFVRNWTKLAVVLVLGFIVLLSSDLAGTTVYGFRESIVLGLLTGLLGDEGLLQKVGAL